MAIGHFHDPIDLSDQPMIVGNDQNSGAIFLRYLAKQPHDRERTIGIETSGRLVCENDTSSRVSPALAASPGRW